MIKKFLILTIICVIIIKPVFVNCLENKLDVSKYLNYKEERVIYLTFDDGPSPNTSKILEILNKQDVKATFFVIGKQIEANKGIIKELEKSGMCILPHTDTHNYRKIYKTSEDYFNDLNDCISKIKNVTLKSPVNFVRFPGGVKNELLKGNVLEEIKQRFLEEKYYFVEWNVYGLDAERIPKDSDEILKSTINQLTSTPKSVVLLHDGYGNANTVDSIEQIICYAKENGYKFKTLEDITERDFEYFVRKKVINFQ